MAWHWEMKPGDHRIHPYDEFLNQFDRVQQAERVKHLERLQAQALREAERLGGVRMREQFVMPPPRTAKEQYLHEVLQQNQPDKLVFKRPAPAGIQAEPSRAAPQLNRKLLLL